jgi:ParB/RepB/Spo0J family partition protein
MTAALPVAALQKGEFSFHPIDSFVPSATNPRKHFDEQKLAEMAKSIAVHGVLEPILARPAPIGQIKFKNAIYEIVAGERRWRAAQLAKKTEIPAIVRELTDKQALEIQTIENAQREDLHPLEQADGYERLIKDFGYTPESIADAIGKSRAHVFQIRKLKSLAPKMREIFLAGDMDTTLATVVARVPSPAMQEHAWQNLRNTFRDGGFSFRVAAEFIRKNYMLDLGRAPFNINDEQLVAKAGACGKCPKRTGNQADLFPDVKNGNVCTDPSCFNEKRNAAQAKEIKTLEAKGSTVLIGAEAKKVMPNGNWLAHDCGYIKPAETCYDDQKRRTWGQLAKQAGVSPTMIQNPHSRALEPIIDLDAVRKGLAARGIKLIRTRQTSKAEKAHKAKQAAARERAALETKARRAAWIAMRAKVQKLDHKDLAAIAFQMWEDIWGDAADLIAEQWKFRGMAEPQILKLKPNELARLLIDLLVERDLESGTYLNSKPKYLGDLCRRHGVPLDKIRAGVLKEEQLKKAAAAAAAKAKARTAPGNVKVRRGVASFLRPMKADAALAVLIGDKPLARTEITKKIWGYIKRNGLQDKKNKRMINADEKLRPIFGKPQISLFEMTKKISAHLTEAK